MGTVGDTKWDLILRSKSKWYDIDLAGVWHYRDLIRLFVRRDFVAQYKQTILGPLWMFIQPLLTVTVFTLIFGVVANIPTDGVPRIVFYLAAYVPWTYFSECFSKNAGTFTSNAGIFGKVYFPRLVQPISVMISNLFRLCVQLLLLAVVYAFFSFKGFDGHPNIYILFFPLIILVLGITGMSMGLIVSSLTTKYRDMNFVTGVVIQVLMYSSSIVYSFSAMPDAYKSILKWNPFLWLIEASRYALLGTGTWNWNGLFYSLGFMFVITFAGIVIFNKVEKSFMDTV